MFRILFVDDDLGMRTLMQRVLAFDYHVQAAEDGEEALRVLEGTEDPFAVVVADMSMPRGNGIQLLSAARQRYPQTARILMSGDIRFMADPSLAQEAQLFRLLIKPVDNPTVLAAVRAGVAHFAGSCTGLRE